MSFTVQKDDSLLCTLCPHGCTIREGKSGICRVRFNKGGELSLPYYGSLSSVATDPIEKKPLYHFYPGAPILSIGFFGCNFRCPFCQNYTISQRVVEQARTYEPRDVVALAKEQGSFGIAYTYSEPVVHFEFVRDTASIARDAGLKNVIVTNGYLNPEPAAELFELVDAANVDLKSFNDSFYKSEIGGRLEPVKSFIRQAYEAGVHVEVTTLVIPGKNDGDGETREIADFIASIDSSIPFHLSAYYPTYQYKIERTSPERISSLMEVAHERLEYVYAGNIASPSSDTECPACGATLIRRRGYRTEVVGIEHGACARCGHTVDIPGT